MQGEASFSFSHGFTAAQPPKWMARRDAQRMIGRRPPRKEWNLSIRSSRKGKNVGMEKGLGEGGKGPGDVPGWIPQGIEESLGTGRPGDAAGGAPLRRKGISRGPEGEQGRRLV